MKFFKFPLTLLLTILLFSNTGLCASVWMSWFKSFSVFAQNPAVTSLAPAVKPPASVAPFFAGVSKAVKALSWSDWLDDKCTFTFKPVKGMQSLGKLAWDNKGWTSTCMVCSVFAGYYLNKKFKCWWKNRCTNYKAVYDLVSMDMNNTTQNNELTALEYANKCQTIYFAKDQYLVDLVTDFYFFRKNGNNKYAQILPLHTKGDAILKYAFGFYSGC